MHAPLRTPSSEVVNEQNTKHLMKCSAWTKRASRAHSCVPELLRNGESSRCGFVSRVCRLTLTQTKARTRRQSRAGVWRARAPHTRARAHVRTHARMHIHLHTRKLTHSLTNTHEHMRAHARTHARTHAREHVRTVNPHALKHTHARTYALTREHERARA